LEHVQQLLQDAGLTPTTQVEESAPGSTARSAQEPLVTIAVPAAQLEHAQAVVGLVLPELLQPTSDTIRLSDRLIRQDEHPAAPNLLDGRGAFDATAATSSASQHPADTTPEPYDFLEDEEYVPPAPPAIPRPRDPVSRFAWGAVLLGPILLLVAALFGLSGSVSGLGLGLFVGGFVTLIIRHEEAPRDGWDDGAVV
jgi:hypothetical protein